MIAGYDEGGDVLIGWSFFQGFPDFAGQLEFEENGMFRKRDWLPELSGLLLIGEPGARAGARTIALGGLENGLTLLRRPLAQSAYAVGIAAYDAWIDAVLDDSQVDGVPPEVLQERNNVHQSQAGLFAELRCYGAEWIAGTAALFPFAEDELGQAAGRFYREHDLMWRVWEQTGEDHRVGDAPGDPAAIFARRDTRERIAAVVRDAKASDLEAAAHLETALERIHAQGDRPGPGNAARRSVIADVPYIGFDAARTDNAYKNTFFVAAMEAGLKVVGDPLSYTLLMGVTGAAFHLAWNTEVWDGGNQSTLTIGEDPIEHIRRAFRAAGWDPYVVGNRTWREMDDTTPGAPQRTSIYQRPDYFGDHVDFGDEARFRQILIDNLRYKRYPVLAYGVQLLPECGIVFGYDEGGDVLIGWNHFQGFEENLAQGKLGFEPDGAFRKRDWYPDTAGLVTFAYKSPRPSLAETCRSALGWAVSVTRTPRFRRWHNGLAAYDAWARALENDADFDGVSDEDLGIRLMCHNDALGSACDGRADAARFLRLAAGALPDKAAALTAAAGVYDAEVRTLVKLVDVLGGYGHDPEVAERLRRPDTRARLAAIIREAKGQEEAAIAWVEQALEA